MELIDQESSVTRWLRRSSPLAFTIYASVAAFCLYTCIFALRKTFTVATFSDISYLGIDYKIWLVMFQVMGYASAKFLGIKIISELKARSRAFGILLMSGIATISWLFFALVPHPYNIIFLFFNGMPLGLVWGMVFGYVEGRRNTDVLGAALAVSFIFSAGLGKSVGGFVMRDWQVSEFWMPLVSSLLFFVPLLFFLWMLNQLPPPSAQDEAVRAKRQPMTGAERKKFVATFMVGLVLLILMYAMLTAFRDLRDNFSADVWKELGYDNPQIFTRTETPISLLILVIMGSIVFIANNYRAFMLVLVLILLGMVLLGVATWMFQEGLIGPPVWMTLIGMGLYLGYIPFNSVFFDRMLATFRYAGTVGFLMYLADSVGYVGSIGVMFYKQFGRADVSWLNYFISGSYALSILGGGCILGAIFYFRRKYRGWVGEA
ncbi:MAG: DUF5690 family protein [Cyclobacteriaceae bacterium]